jgi:type VI secretion system secreted protein VgrG
MPSDVHPDAVEIRLESAAFSVDRLRVRKLSGREVIGQLYTFDLLVVCLDHTGVDLDTVAGAEATLVFERGGAEVRSVHGVIVEADDHFSDTADTRVYRLRLAPRAYRMGMIHTHDIFVDVSVPDLIRQKLALVGLDDTASLRLLGDYAARELVIQFDETDLAFVCRLAEHLGVSLFFEQRDGLDTVVLTDHRAGFQPAPGAETLTFHGHGEHRELFELRAQRRIVPSYYAVRDYDDKNPMLDLTADQHLPTGQAGGVIEQDSHHKTPSEGKVLARARAEERESARLVYAGKSDRCELAAGARFRLEEHPDLDALDLLVVEVEHEATLVAAGSAGAGAPSYANTFRAVPADTTYRPPRVTPRPRVSGLVTGVIDATLTGNQAHAPIDEQGRYRVRFLFDTAPVGQRRVSCPIRMLQNHVGENYGTHFPLRAGAEVLVGFVYGDPDRPVIVGAAPNPLKPSPVTGKFPASHQMKTASGITIEMVDEP